MFGIEIDVGSVFEAAINWLTVNWSGFFDGIRIIVAGTVEGFEAVLQFLPSWFTTLLLAGIALYVAGRGVAIFALLGFFLIDSMGLWMETMNTLALIFTSVFIALLIGLPIGVWASKNEGAERYVRPTLDFMQTMPAFVYLIPAVLFFQLGKVPGAVATLIFAMPPAVRFTNLGIRQVPAEIKEAAKAFGSTPSQLLFKVELPVALPTIMGGINQTIMLALSMVVIASLIGAGGLGDPVLRGITQLRIGLGFEGGIAIVILAMYLDRVTQALGNITGQGK
jgi:glycine betaine/proline transport system permease protein